MCLRATDRRGTGTAGGRGSKGGGTNVPQSGSRMDLPETACQAHSRHMAIKVLNEAATLKRLGYLHKGDHLHLVMSQGCADREIAAELPGGSYLLTDGGTVRALTAINYPRPDQCDRQAPPAAPQEQKPERDFTIPSATQPGVTYKVHISPTGHLFCNCHAGSYGRPCRHKREVERRLAAERSGQKAA